MIPDIVLTPWQTWACIVTAIGLVMGPIALWNSLERETDESEDDAPADGRGCREGPQCAAMEQLPCEDCEREQRGFTNHGSE